MAIIETSSTRSATPPCVELTPSVRLRWWLGAGLLGALFSVAVLPLPLWQRLTGALLVLIVSAWRWRGVTSRYPQAVRKDPTSGWSLLVSHEWCDARSWRCTYLTPTLVIIEVELVGMGRYRLPLLADQTDAESWRWLRRCLMREESGTL